MAVGESTFSHALQVWYIKDTLVVIFGFFLLFNRPGVERELPR